MKVTSEQLEGNKVKLQIQVDAGQTDRAIQQAYHKMVKKVDIPGFRKGKVPKRVLEARFGKNIFDQDAIEILFPQVYFEAVKEAAIEPIDQPTLEDYQLEEGSGATFTVEVEVKPEVKLGQYTGLDLVKEVEGVGEEEVAGQIEQLRDRMAQLVPADREIVEDEDYVVIDFSGRKAEEDEPFDGGSAEDYTLQIGSGSFIPGFEEQLVGAKVGEDLKVEVDFPEDYHQEDLAGEAAIFNVRVKEIKVKELPALDDEFAKDIGEFESLEDLRNTIRENLAQQKEDAADTAFKEELFEKLAENTEIDIPEKMIENEKERLFEDYSWRLRQQGIDIDDFLSRIGTTKEEWLEQRREEAEKRVRNNLILEAVTEREGIEATEEEVNDRIRETAEQNDQDPEKLIARMKQNRNYEDLKYSFSLDKTMQFLQEKNTREIITEENEDAKTSENGDTEEE